MSKNIIALIPARSGSKTVIDKNIKQLGSHPLLAYSIALAKLSKNISRVIVSTDSPKYATIAKNYGAEVPFLRPAEIAGDNSVDSDFFRHLIDWMREKEGYIPDFIVHLRPTTPLRQVQVVDDAITYMIHTNEATALRSAHKTHLTPYKMFRLCGEFMSPFLKYDGIKEFYNLPRQFFEDAYIPNGYVDIIRPTTLLNTGLLHGNKIKLWETDLVPDVDTTSDFNFACKLLNEYKNLTEYMEDISNG